jgi:hypothetical protein
MRKELSMKTRVFPVLLVIGAAVIAVRFLLRSGRVSPENLLERMPETSPPKWMFTNIEAIRQNTDRLLERVAALEAAAR